MQAGRKVGLLGSALVVPRAVSVSLPKVCLARRLIDCGALPAYACTSVGQSPEYAALSEQALELKEMVVQHVLVHADGNQARDLVLRRLHSAQLAHLPSADLPAR